MSMALKEKAAPSGNGNTHTAKVRKKLYNKSNFSTKELELNFDNEFGQDDNGQASKHSIKSNDDKGEGHSMNDIPEWAKMYVDYGLSIIPVNGDKTPALPKWKAFQERPMTPTEAKKYFKNATGIGIICGIVSGNLEVIDIDCKYDSTGNLAKEFFDLVENHLPGLLKKTPITKTINKGYHMYYRCNKIKGNQQFAKNSKDEVLIETRGTGGYVIAPPSPGYELKRGDLEDIPVISTEDREMLLNICRSFDESPQKEINPTPSTSNNGSDVFGDYNDRADVLSLLERHGWKQVKTEGQRVHFLRPGNSKSKVSGNWHTVKKLFYPFTSSTQFEAGKGYNATGVFTLLECNGDFTEASHKLYDEGYGDRRIPAELKEPKLTTREPIQLLPITGFPIQIQNLINKCVDVYRTPRDYWAGAVIAATALGIGDKLELKTKYSNIPIFWICIVGDVSSGKTEAQKLIMKPFEDIDNFSHEKYKKENKEYDRLSKLSKKERVEEGITDVMEKPFWFQFRTKDSTPEALAAIHEINRRGLVIDREELKGWLDDFGRYNKSGEQYNMLSTWNRVSVIYNRKGSEPINIPEPVINVLGGMHPDLLPCLAADSRAENGFVSRFCFVYPDNSRKQKYCNEKIPNEIYLEWEKFIKDLLSLTEFTQLSLTPEAQRIYEKWFNENVKKTNAEPSQHLKGVYGKLDIISLRLAIVLKGMNLIFEGDYNNTISAEIMQSAIEITEYFRATALKVYDKMFEGKKSTNKSEIIKWVLLNMKKTKAEIARFFETSRSQLDRIEKNF
jgi:hypothetical protein